MQKISYKKKYDIVLTLSFMSFLIIGVIGYMGVFMPILSLIPVACWIYCILIYNKKQKEPEE